MLVLCRKPEEQIQIGPNITVTIIRVKGRSVVIGIEAPGNVKVLRGEFVDQGGCGTLDATLPDSSDSSQVAETSRGASHATQDSPSEDEDENDGIPASPRPARRGFAHPGSRRPSMPGNWS